MSALVTQRCHRLASSLGELKIKVRAALATELAGAVGLAVRDALVAALIDRMLAPTRPAVRPPAPRTSGWRDEDDEDRDRWGHPKDPWTDPDDDDPRGRARTRYEHEEYDDVEPAPAVPMIEVMNGFVRGQAAWRRQARPGRLAKYRSRRPSSLSKAARTCRIASAPDGRFQNFDCPFTRALNSPTNDSTKLLVVGRPSRRYRG